MSKETNRNIIGKMPRPTGEYPSVVLTNPKFDHNVGQTVRAASCFGCKQVWYTGNRVKIEPGKRLPREERMKGYGSVDLIQHNYPFDSFENGVVPVAIELVENCELLTTFEHPEKAVYVFGPEDGSIPQVIRRHCHKFVKIPVKHCTNLSMAVGIVLYDRMQKLNPVGFELAEERGWYEHQG